MVLLGKCLDVAKMSFDRCDVRDSSRLANSIGGCIIGVCRVFVGKILLVNVVANIVYRVFGSDV